MKILNITIRSWLIIAVALLISGCLSNSGVLEESGNFSTADSPSMMNVGDIMVIDLSDDDAIIDFKDVESSVEFTLIIGTSDIYAGGRFQIITDQAPDLSKSTIASASKDVSAMGSGGSSGSVGSSSEGIFDAGCILSSLLRERESKLASSEPRPDISDARTVSSFDPMQTFKVIFNINSDTWTYGTVEARIKCVGEKVLIFIDNGAENDVLSSNEIEDLCEEFDRVATHEIEILGDPSDVNNDGLVTVLITPWVNRLSASMGEGVAGYFFGGDLYEASDTNPVSNNQEIIFIPAPDPNGRYGSVISKEFLLDNVLQPTFAHELQHAINYNRHVFVNRGPTEERWLNEGISRLIEDVVGYGDSNISLYSIFLADTSVASLTTASIMSHAENGAIYLFLRYLYEQANDGKSFIGALVNSDVTGVGNLEKAFAGPDENFSKFQGFMIQWSAALAMNNGGLTDDARYSYLPPVYNSETDNMSGVVIQKDADNNDERKDPERVQLSNIVSHANQLTAPSSIKYYSITGISGEVAINAEGFGNFATLIRTK